MDKIEFTFSDGSETVEFFVVEETVLAGCQYLLVTEDEEDEEATAYVLKNVAEDGGDAIYEFVEDDDELEAVSILFGELLEDVDVTTQD